MSEPTLNQHLAAVRESLGICTGAKNQSESQPAPKKPTIAKMKCKRFIDGDTKMIEILKISGVSSSSQLPNEYTRQAPYFQWLDGKKAGYLRIIDVDWAKICVLYVGSTITYKRYGELMRIMKEAGQRLTDINARRKKEKEFSGEFEVTI